MKLELKHLAGYLPYEVKVCCIGSFTTPKPIHKLNYGLGLGNINHLLTSNRYKICLRPLSDLTKEEFYHLWSHETDFESIIKFTESDTETIESYKFSLSFWNGIHENHFDIYGLIENNLAIDINTL